MPCFWIQHTSLNTRTNGLRSALYFWITRYYQFVLISTISSSRAMVRSPWIQLNSFYKGTRLGTMYTSHGNIKLICMVCATLCMQHPSSCIGRLPENCLGIYFFQGKMVLVQTLNMILLHSSSTPPLPARKNETFFRKIGSGIEITTPQLSPIGKTLHIDFTNKRKERMFIVTTNNPTNQH